MALIKRLKNNSGSKLQILNRDTQHGEYYDVPYNKWLEAAESSTLESLIQSGSIVVNDGSSDLNASDGVELVKRFQFDAANKISFNNTTNGFTSTNVQSAIEELKTLASKKRDFLHYQIIGNLNYNNYLYSGSDLVSGLLTSSRRSGDASNGYRYSNSAPTLNAITGKVVKLNAAIQGIAVSSGSPSSTIYVNLELWKVGMTNEGTKIGNMVIPVNTSTYNVGTYYNSSVDTNFVGSISLNLSVTENDLLAVKFSSQTGNSNAVAIENISVKLEVLQS